MEKKPEGSSRPRRDDAVRPERRDDRRSDDRRFSGNDERRSSGSSSFGNSGGAEKNLLVLVGSKNLTAKILVAEVEVQIQEDQVPTFQVAEEIHLTEEANMHLQEADLQTESPAQDVLLEAEIALVETELAAAESFNKISRNILTYQPF